MGCNNSKANDKAISSVSPLKVTFQEPGIKNYDSSEKALQAQANARNSSRNQILVDQDLSTVKSLREAQGDTTAIEEKRPLFPIQAPIQVGSAEHIDMKEKDRASRGKESVEIANEGQRTIPAVLVR